ncbi:MAG: hypothetical protein JGK38_23830 [Microcoleus sp. PH2017_15_JOR_U_A]|uniref:hypothetical protein n=1 Tax=unclassified Microcoleus TaxID=2642155 RepID=UPI001D65A499|nr:MULTISPECIES: hypothetical protein [unclassified Microcoleus]MCC3473288.1 hypothetical protein [Microcoleus sp. PH2017_13_LAR_U_A]MCC3486545.1 hypothetical protein [Microcoleus sp. PH2017_14_LAR_D_A]MCC3499587.1 hypothetical protein [Microcoleus sp. PH2017_15_JOR_U_A]MCC3600159.1 hypothetical protein [Microcoleus sp. PH2017_26_ELK_O_A]MCC3623188.1 hypothetical protein [Microcoleus sp. PH2017_36_ELK_O_B]
MEEFTTEQKLKIRDYFDDPNYSQPHGEVVATQLLAAMIASGKYELEEYPRLAEAAIRLTAILVVRFDDEVKREVRETTNPKPSASEKDTNSDPDSEACDPIPF